MTKEQKFRYESAQDPQSLAVYLTALAGGFQAGELRFSAKNARLTTRPTGLIGFVVEAKSKEGRHKVTLKFTWRDQDDQDDQDQGRLSIGGEGADGA